MSDETTKTLQCFAAMPKTQVAAWNAYSQTKPPEGNVHSDVISRARELAEQGNAAQAEELLRAEPDLENSFDALNALVLLLQRQERLDEAEAMARTAIAALRQSEAKLMANLANGLIMQRRWPEAVDAARTSTSLDPRRSSGWINLTFALARQKRTDELKHELRKMNAQWPNWRTDPTVAEALNAPLLREIVAETLSEGVE